jgi:hypothetical protein
MRQRKAKTPVTFPTETTEPQCSMTRIPSKCTSQPDCPICAEWKYRQLVAVCPICGQPGGLHEVEDLAATFLREMEKAHQGITVAILNNVFPKAVVSEDRSAGAGV